MDNYNLTGFETEEEILDNLLKLLDEPTLFAQELNVSFPMSPDNNAQDLNVQYPNALCPTTSFPLSPNNNAQDLNAQYPNATHHNALCPSASFPMSPNNNTQHPDVLFSTPNSTHLPTSPSMTITVEENFTFRNPNEMKDSTGKTSTHGHLKGNITFKPPLDSKKDLWLELSLVPSDLKKCMGMVHPNVLYLRFGKHGSKHGTDLTNPKAWRLVLLIKNGIIYYINNDNQKYKLDDLHNYDNGSHIILGKNHLEISIISPLLKSKLEKNELNVESVIKERCSFDQNIQKSETEWIIKQFKGKGANEMKRCCLRASLFEDQYCQMKSTEAISTTICCSRNKFYGHFEVENISYPHACCNKGGWQSLLVSKYEVAKAGVYPVFVLEDGCNIEPVQQKFPKFNQIPDDEVVKSGKNFSFKIPEQEPDVIKALQEFNGNVYLTLYRDSKKDYARNMIEFNYEIHERICPFCTITKLNGYIPPHKSGVPNSKMSFKRRKQQSDDCLIFTDQVILKENWNITGYSTGKVEILQPTVSQNVQKSAMISNNQVSEDLVGIAMAQAGIANPNFQNFNIKENHPEGIQDMEVDDKNPSRLQKWRRIFNSLRSLTRMRQIINNARKK